MRVKKQNSWLLGGLLYLEPVFASIRDGVLITDPKGEIVLANPAIELVSGLLSGDVLHKKVQEIFLFKSEKEEASNFYKEALAGWRAIELSSEAYFTDFTGKQIPVALRATPLYDPKGGYAGVVFVIRDISEEVRRRKEQYEFLSFVSHQFRQPLGALRWGIEAILENKNLTAEEQETLHDLEKVVMRFKNFINDLIDLSHLDRGTLELKHDPVDIKKIIFSVTEEMKGLAESQNVRFNLFPNTKPQDAFVVQGDLGRLTDVFSNLIANAIFYNQPRGEVRVEAEFVNKNFVESIAFKKQGSLGIHDYLKRSPSEKFITVRISDSGLGIPEADQPKIFENFFRGDNVIKKGIAGTGLGLFIVKAIVESSGGRIFFESKENIGTTFIVILPILHDA